ncbi:MAG: NTP transferase domain-containing protein [Opitutaceae bacterium]|nr:NTP transferase domain-containing protein [Opitutaceae bacterium]
MSEPTHPPGVIVLAGGFGTRVSHLLPGVPKPMASVAGRPFVEWVVRAFARWGCREFFMATGHLAHVIENHFKSQPIPNVTISSSVETSPLGTAGGCLNALPSEAAPNRRWLVVNGDSLVLADPRPLLLPIDAGVADASLLGLALPDASRFGSLDIRRDGLLNAFREKTPGAGTINAGVYAFSERTLRELPPTRPLSFEFDVFPALAAKHRVHATTVTAPFLDIGTPETLAAAGQFIATHKGHFV